MKLITCPNIASKNWIFRQYDSMVRTNTINSGISDSAVIRIKDTDKAIAVKTDGNSRYVYLNPKIGAEIAVAESARNVVCSGATPIAITNCLNFGNPYNPETYWQFKETIDGISNACKIFETPVTGGNVSFYNESPNYTVFPTPVIGMLGLIESLQHITTMEFKSVGNLIVLLGKVSSDLSGSEYLKLFYGINGPDAPFIDLDYEHRVQKACICSIKSGLLNSAHDISDGGLAVCIAECCIASGLGADIKIDEELSLDKLIFGESQSRIIVTVDKSMISRLKDIALVHQIDLMILGKVVLENLKINSVINLSVEKMRDGYQESLRKIIEGETKD
jgi:phosphoribosylformylglycinamidine synthase